MTRNITLEIQPKFCGTSWSQALMHLTVLTVLWWWMITTLNINEIPWIRIQLEYSSLISNNLIGE